MKSEDLVSNFPVVYHMTEVDCWPGIKKHGLLSTSALLDAFGIKGQRRLSIEATQRKERVLLNDPTFGSVVIRDQKPLSEVRLAKCLTGMTTRDWYSLLNRKVFLWPSERRLDDLLRARAYRDRAHLVLHLSTQDLVTQYAKAIQLSPINSGATLPMAHARGPDTFLAIEDYPFEKWKKTRGAKKAIAEIAVDYAIPNVMDLVTKVETRESGLPPRKVRK